MNDRIFIDWGKSEKFWRDRGYSDLADACQTVEAIRQRYTVNEHKIITFLKHTPDRQFIEWFKNANQ